MSATWRKSSHSYSNGNCLEVAGSWRKSAAGNYNGSCVEVADLPDGVIGVRDSKDPGGPVLTVGRAGWEAFLAGVRNGELVGIVP